MASAPPVEHGLDAEGLATLLTAELSGQRGDYRRATLGYLAMAERYEAARLAERGTLAARFSNDPQLLEQAVSAWHDLAPQEEAPLRLLAGLALQRGDWTKALDWRLALAEQGQHAELTLFAELALESGTDPLPLRERLQGYLERTGAGAHPHYHDAVLAMAILEAATGQHQQAERRLDLLARDHSELPALWLTRTGTASRQSAPGPRGRAPGFGDIAQRSALSAVDGSGGTDAGQCRRRRTAHHHPAG